MTVNLNSDYVPALKIYTGSIVSYARYVGPKRDKEAPKHNSTHPILSEQSARKIKKIIDFIDSVSHWHKVPCLETSCKEANPNGKAHYHNFKLGFLTLTLPASQLSRAGLELMNKQVLGTFEKQREDFIPIDFKYTDNEIKSFCLNHFLTILREKYNVKNYLWKAEAQENGNIHFHIIIDQFIHYKKLQYVWNRCLSKTQLIDEFEKKWKHRQPPTIEIHAIKDIKNTKKYLTKYLTKSDELHRKIDGRRWSCNEELSQYKGVTIELTGIKIVEKSKLFNLPEKYKYYPNDHDFFHVYKVDTGLFLSIMEGTEILKEYIQSFENLYKYTISTN